MPTNKSYYKESSEYSDAVMLDLLVGRTVDSELGEFVEEPFGVVMTAADTAEPGRTLQYEDTESESEEDSDMEEAETKQDLLWRLYYAVRN